MIPMKEKEVTMKKMLPVLSAITLIFAAGMINGCRHERHPGAEFVVDYLAESLDANDAQRRQMEQIKSELLAKGKAMRTESAVPIIMLTARGEVADRVIGLELGADDYLAKPFEPRELVARIHAVLRRRAPAPDVQKAVFGDLEIDFERRRAMPQGRDVELTTNEFAALALLVRHAGKVLSRDQILQELRGIDCDAFNRSVDITMSRVRQKLGDDPQSPVFIKTVWGTGYLFIGGKTA
jgi:DNA-binding response OmpR family regulator